MAIVQFGNINTTALIVPDLYVQIVPPQNLVLNGVPTNVLGMVGTASWGPVGTPSILGSMADYARNFGPIVNRKYDLGTPVATAVQQGASNFRALRVSDGTDTVAYCQFNFSPVPAWIVNHVYGATLGQLVAANGNIYVLAASSGTLASSALGGGGPSGTGTGIVDGGLTWNFVIIGAYNTSATVIALYSGTFGNSIRVSLAAGSAAGTWKLIIAPPGGILPEVFDNIPAPTNAIFWVNLQNAVNSGNSPQRGPSQFCLVSGGGAVGSSFSAPAIGNTFAGGINSTGSGSLNGMNFGTDGVTTITAATLIGQDTVPRKGMYALRGTGCSVMVLSDADDSTQFTTQAAFCLQEGIYGIVTTPAGDTISNAATVKATAGIDTYALKYMFGDWVWWNDQVNGVLRLVSPQGFVAGRLANLSPENSSLNKPLYGVVGSQKSGAPGSGQVLTYSSAELQALLQVGIDVIANPQPGGSFWGVRGGHNSSSNSGTNGDNYTRLTNFVGTSLNAGMGRYVGQVINRDHLKRIKATLTSFCQTMLGQGLLGTIDGSLPFSIICDISNNPDARTSLGYVQADCQIKYQAINEKFIVNLEGGQTVQISRTTTPLGQIAA